MTAAPAEPGFGFEDTVPVSQLAAEWSDFNHPGRTGTSPFDLRELKTRGDRLAIAAHALTVQYLELLSAHERQSQELDTAQREIDRFSSYLAEDDESDAYEVAQFVRWEHDRSHFPYGWAICPKEMCRAAARYVK